MFHVLLNYVHVYVIVAVNNGSLLVYHQFVPVDCLFLDEPFILLTEVQCLSPWKLHLDQAKHHWGKNLTTASQFAPQLNGCELLAFILFSSC